jgi:NhaP-type Na+/H+ and K+/H+ antiporter
MYGITDVELDVLESNYESSSFNFWQLCLGIFIGFLVPLLTVQLSNRICAIFVAIVVASGLLALSFGIKWIRERAKAKQHIKQIKERPRSN